MEHALVRLAYLAASVLFILGLKGLTHPRTAVRGNRLAAAGMLVAVVATLLDQEILHPALVFGGILVGSAAGVLFGLKTPMTGMPQLVALFNGFGGGASALVAGAELQIELGRGGAPGAAFLAATAASGLIGIVTLTGSVLAALKLQELVSGRAIVFRGQQALNAAVLVIALGLAGWMGATTEPLVPYWAMCVVAAAFGALFVLPIGGADMPVVIALLNSLSGVAAAATGFALLNDVLIVAGSLVGASGLILTRLMCHAMNRSLLNVLVGGVGAGPVKAGEEIYEGRVKATSPDEVAMLLAGARRVVIVPGYGMAVAQAQHAVRDLMSVLRGRGTEVVFAIHPVAGRMPGHMNVLLAEADIPYDRLLELEPANALFPETDVAIVLGANDVVNPVARTDPTSPIAGMPILDVDKARVVVVMKRSLSPGFAGIPNPLFAADNTLMLFADGKKAVLDLLAAVKGA